jgi:hypothetical protein
VERSEPSVARTIDAHAEPAANQIDKTVKPARPPPVRASVQTKPKDRVVETKPKIQEPDRNQTINPFKKPTPR